MNNWPDPSKHSGLLGLKHSQLHIFTRYKKVLADTQSSRKISNFMILKNSDINDWLSMISQEYYSAVSIIMPSSSLEKGNSLEKSRL